MASPQLEREAARLRVREKRAERRLRDSAPKLLAALKSARLMLHAYAGYREKTAPPEAPRGFPELEDCIRDAEVAIADAEGSGA